LKHKHSECVINLCDTFWAGVLDKTELMRYDGPRSLKVERI